MAGDGRRQTVQQGLDKPVDAGLEKWSLLLSKLLKGKQAQKPQQTIVQSQLREDDPSVDHSTSEDSGTEDARVMGRRNDEEIALGSESSTKSIRKKKKVYKTDAPRGPTRNLHMAKMRPGEKIKVDFNINGQPISANRATFANFCGALVRDPLNAPLYKIEEYSQIPEDFKEKMWDLILEKFDIGINDEEDEELREMTKKSRRNYVWKSLNKKYRNYRARLKAVYYDTEENDTERLKDKNRPPDMDKRDWKWLVEYFGSEKYQEKSVRNVDNRSYQDAGHTAGTKSFAQVADEMFNADKEMPSMLKLYEKTHTNSNNTPVTGVAGETMAKVAEYLQQREVGEITLTDEEIYMKAKPSGKRGRGRGLGISPSISSLYGSFAEAEKLRKEGQELRKEAEEAKKEALDAKREASEASEKNKILTDQVNGLTGEVKLMKGFMEQVLYDLGYADVMQEVNLNTNDDSLDTMEMIGE